MGLSYCISRQWHLPGSNNCSLRRFSACPRHLMQRTAKWENASSCQKHWPSDHIHQSCVARPPAPRNHRARTFCHSLGFDAGNHRRCNSRDRWKEPQALIPPSHGVGGSKPVKHIAICETVCRASTSLPCSRIGSLRSGLDLSCASAHLLETDSAAGFRIPTMPISSITKICTLPHSVPCLQICPREA
jgi:hypothetical protein